MNKNLKIVYHILLFCIILSFRVFPYSKSKIGDYESPTSNGYLEAHSEIVYNQLMNLKDVKVKFTQDNDKYNFEVTANASIKIYGNLFSTSDSSWASSINPVLYKEDNFGNNIQVSETIKAPNIDRKSGSFYERSVVSIAGKVQSNYDYSYNLSSGSPITTNDSINKNDELYFIPKPLRSRAHTNINILKYALNYPINCTNNGIGVSLEKNNSSYRFSMIGEYYDTYYANIDVKFSINKNYFSHYRYLCFAHTFMASEYGSISDTGLSYTGLSVSSNTIDLKEYANCEHNFIYRPKDKSSHIIFCDKCKWERIENHSLIYEYDGLKNNVCTCSYIDKVKYVFDINDDTTGIATEICDTESQYNKHTFIHKTGYNFKWYEKYEKKYVDDKHLSTTYNALSENLISTTSEIDDITGRHSVKYIAKYSPIKFKFNYSDVNSYNLKIDDIIDSQVVYYDENANLKKAKEFKGYIFKGWTLNEGSKDIDLKDLADVTNYTSIDLKEYDLYPVYERLDYTIVLNAGSYLFSNGENEKIFHHNYFDEGLLERPYLNSDDMMFYAYVDKNGNEYKNLSDVRRTIEKMNTTNATLYLFASVGSTGIGKAEHTSKESTEPTKKSYLVESIEETEQTFTLPTFYLYETSRDLYNKRTISGMSDTEKEIVDEENEENNYDNKKVATISLINKFNFDKTNNLKKSKLEILRLYIGRHKLMFIVFSILLIILLILYERSLIKHFSKRKTSK